MAARLTDKQKKKIIADYVEIGSYNAVAKLHGVTRQTVKNVVTADTGIGQLLQQKKEENTADILSYMEEKRSIVCEILGKGLDILNDPEKLREATPSQITTALGTLIDKWSMITNKPQDDRIDDGLSKSLRELAKEMESDGET